MGLEMSFEVGDLVNTGHDDDTTVSLVSAQELDEITVQVCKELMFKWAYSFEHTDDDFVWIRSVISFWFNIDSTNWSDAEVKHFTCQTFLNINFAKCEPVCRDK